MEEINVVGVGMTPFGRMLGKDSAALADAGSRSDGVRRGLFAGASQGQMETAQIQIAREPGCRQHKVNCQAGGNRSLPTRLSVR